jgi:outer membrane receptor protein involved in Fe transport
MNLRFGFNKTLARPEFREIAPFTYFNFIENVNVKGNPDLVRTLVDNYDLRYEIFPGAAELLAVSVFYKYFRNPIEQTLLASSQNEPVRSYANAENAQNIGAELEVRKGLGFIGNSFTNFSAVANISVIRSRVQFESDGESTSYQQNDRPLQGQANYIVNVGLYYDDFNLGLNSSFTYNRVGPRIAQVGYADIGNVIEEPFDLLDFNISKKVFQKFTLKLTVNDILNQDKIFTQETENFGDQLAQSYNTGRTFKFSINYNL